MARAAKDPADYERTRARLYAPPPGLAAGRDRRRTTPPAGPAGPGPQTRAGMTRAQALAMMAALGAEDAHLSSGGRTG
ncbi:hypothetical protein ACFOWE_18290 [Planomonospora corallina]|uniref:Uncharacterized protein n=2 Tax=Planomonospora corallina TaxID=1806052 RepID=A0ABV8I7T4_9ACTN